ncbi:MAG: MATE family efflux transporter [Proteocatella sp.]
MELKRNSYLINKSFKTYLFTSILSSVAVTLGVVVDASIVGNLVGGEALSAINLCVPIIQLMNAINALINIGGAMMLAMALGRLEIKEGMKYYTLSMILTLVFSVFIMLASLLFIDPIVNILCTEDTLKPLVKTYAQVVMMSAPLYLFVPGICTFIRIDSNPKLSSLVLILTNVFNLLFDIILVKYFSMGVFGAALSTSIGYLIGFFIALLHFKSKTCTLKFFFNFEFHKITQIFTTGLPMALASALMTVRLLYVNATVLATLGTSGMQIMAVCFNILMISTIFIGGSAQALQPIAGVLIGSEDYTGVKFAVNTAIKILIGFVTMLVILIMIFPHDFASLFGVSALPNLDSSIRYFALCVPLYALNYIFMVNYQILSMKPLSISISCLQSLMVIPVMSLIAGNSPPLIWLAFPIGEAIVLGCIFLAATIYKSKDATLSFITLIPPDKQNTSSFSVGGDIEDIGKMIDDILDFLKRNNIDETASKKLALCCEELVKNITTYAYNNNKHRYVDINLKIFPTRILALIKDDGSPFNPIEFKSKDGLGLVLVKGIC